MSDEGSLPHSNKKPSNNIPSNWAQKWSDEEDKRLLMGIEQYGENNWRMVAKIVGTRDAVKCMQRWEKGLKPGIIKGRWSEEEDRALVYLVSQGYKNWGQVAQHMPGRTSKQCRERWNHYLDPTLIHTPFTEEEDQLLLSLQREHGNKWALIARSIPGRTENAVKLRHHALMKKVSSQQYVGNSSKEMGRLANGENNLHSDNNRHVMQQNGNNGHGNLSSSTETHMDRTMFHNHHNLIPNDGNFRRDEERVDNTAILNQQQQQQQRLYNTLRENNDNRHPMGNFQHYQHQQQQQQQQQLQQHYRLPPFDMTYSTSSQIPIQQQQPSPEIHLNKRQRVDLPPPPLPAESVVLPNTLPATLPATLPTTLQLQQLHYLSNNFPQLLQLHQQYQQQRQPQYQHQLTNNEALPWQMISQPALQIEEVQCAETEFSNSQTHNEALLNLVNYSLPYNEGHRRPLGGEVEIESDELDDDDEEDDDEDDDDDDEDDEEDDSSEEEDEYEERGRESLLRR